MAVVNTDESDELIFVMDPFSEELDNHRCHFLAFFTFARNIPFEQNGIKSALTNVQVY